MSDEHVRDPAKEREFLPERTITLEEAAKACGVTILTMRRWITEGRLRAYRLGPRLIRVETEDINALFEPMGPGEPL